MRLGHAETVGARVESRDRDSAVAIGGLVAGVVLLLAALVVAGPFGGEEERSTLALAKGAAHPATAVSASESASDDVAGRSGIHPAGGISDALRNAVDPTAGGVSAGKATELEVDDTTLAGRSVVRRPDLPAEFYSLRHGGSGAASGSILAAPVPTPALAAAKGELDDACYLDDVDPMATVFHGDEFATVGDADYVTSIAAVFPDETGAVAFASTVTSHDNCVHELMATVFGARISGIELAINQFGTGDGDQSVLYRVSGSIRFRDGTITVNWDLGFVRVGRVVTAVDHVSLAPAGVAPLGTELLASVASNIAGQIRPR